MSLFNIFSDKGIINVIPFFTAIYLAYYESQILVPIFLVLSVITFYIIVKLLSDDISKKVKFYQNKKDLEDNVLDELLKRDYGKINGFFALAHWILIAITAIILYNHREDFVVFLFFWYLVVGFIYNFISLFISHGDFVKKSFKKL